jgi:undecaprenyl pyrophosphate phosphatase UppP
MAEIITVLAAIVAVIAAFRSRLLAQLEFLEVFSHLCNKSRSREGILIFIL